VGDTDPCLTVSENTINDVCGISHYAATSYRMMIMPTEPEPFDLVVPSILTAPPPRLAQRGDGGTGMIMVGLLARGYLYWLQDTPP
jgi:hypothetical protein